MPKMKPGIEVNLDPCTGCLSCMAVCSQHRSRSASNARSAVRVDLDQFTGLHTIYICRQCDKAACAEICSAGAIQKNEVGVWLLNTDICSGCGACVEACPFGSMFWDIELDKPFKCDTCQGEFACVQACHFGVLQRRSPGDDVIRGIPPEDLDPGLGRE